MPLIFGNPCADTTHWLFSEQKAYLLYTLIMWKNMTQRMMVLDVNSQRCL